MILLGGLIASRLLELLILCTSPGDLSPIPWLSSLSLEISSSYLGSFKELNDLYGYIEWGDIGLDLSTKQDFDLFRVIEGDILDIWAVSLGRLWSDS